MSEQVVVLAEARPGVERARFVSLMTATLAGLKRGDYETAQEALAKARALHERMLRDGR